MPGRRTLLLLVLTQCSPSPPPKPAPAPPPALTTAEPTVATTVATNAARAASSAPQKPAAQPEIPKREAAPGSTRNAISCGTKRCRAPGEACFLAQDPYAWTCRAVSPPDQAARHSYEDIGMHCDDGLDCPQGQTCCNTFGYNKRVCVKRADVLSTCAAEICIEDGARCPAGRSCTAKGRSEGVCKAPEGPATCVGKLPCPKHKPICVVAGSSLSCVAAGSAEHQAVAGDRRFHCTRQRDCHAGDTCQYVFGEVRHPMHTFCGPHMPAYGGSVVCDPTQKRGCTAPTGEVGKALPWMGVGFGG